MPYAVIVTSNERRSEVPGNPVVTRDGDRFWVTIEREGWVDATSSPCNDPRKPPADLKTWPTKEKASSFAKRWKGHPWWCDPKPDQFQVVRVERTTRQVHAGYRRA